MRLLNINLPDDIVKKVTASYADMTPVERFMLETVGIHDTVIKSNGGYGGDTTAVREEEDTACASSCAATAGRAGDEREETSA